MERIIFTLSFEKRWDCWMVYAHRAEDAGDFFLLSGRYEGGDREVPEMVEEAARLVRKYDVPILFKLFGKKLYKDERDFLRRLDENSVREQIRPYVGRWVAQTVDMLADAGVPLYMKNSRLENLYKQQRLTLEPVSARAVLRFERNGEFTRYILRLQVGNRMLYPADYDLKVLARNPCRVLAGRQLLRFPADFDGQRLQPFLQKREVVIPKANEQVYFNKFILKHVRNEDIEVQGFDVVVREVEKKALLSLEKEVFGSPMLVLEFMYGDLHMPAWGERKALVELQEKDGSYAFYKIKRDEEWEERTARVLRESGLQEKTKGCFVAGMTGDIAGEPEDAEVSDESLCGKRWRWMLDWIAANREMLVKEGIVFSQDKVQHPYYTGGWEVKFSRLTETDWFELHAEVVLTDGRHIPLACFREHILKGNREYLLEDGTVFVIPEEWFATYAGLMLWSAGKGRTMRVRKSQYKLLEAAGGILPETEQEAVALPAGLRAVLRPYQMQGYEWLYGLFRSGLGGCLADDMGLGKTVQVIALLLKYREEGKKNSVVFRPTAGGQLSLFDSFNEEEHVEGEGMEFHTCLIVVPASLVHNWRNELRKFAPRLTVTVYTGAGRTDARAYLQQSDVVLTTYHILRNDIDYLSGLVFGVVVADEAQMLKNPASQVQQAMLRVRGKWFYALSGTPVENSLSDLWSIMNFSNREILGSHAFFQKCFAHAVMADLSGKETASLRRLIEPYILRRTKEEVLAELPELTSELVFCEPDKEQKSLYETEQSRIRNYIQDYRADGRLRNDFMVLKALIRLRQIANHPKLVEHEYAGGSGKFREIFRMLEDVLGAGHKVLVFSSFVKYLEMVRDEICCRGWKYSMLTGGTSDRVREIERFASEADCRIFLISLKAGGVGLNLTEADYVFILDPWWNLAAENQAVGRAHRMGQKRAVFVYRFITAGTLEEKILALRQRKQQLADSVISASETAALTDEELKSIITGSLAENISGF